MHCRRARASAASAIAIGIRDAYANGNEILGATKRIKDRRPKDNGVNVPRAIKPLSIKGNGRN